MSMNDFQYAAKNGFVIDLKVENNMSKTSARLEYLRSQIQAENISMSEVAELQSLALCIPAWDVELLEWAGVPELSTGNMESVELEYSAEVETAIMNNFTEFFQLGETVCGAADPAVVELADSFKLVYPYLAQFAMVRIVDRFVNANRSDTFFVFSNQEITHAEELAAGSYYDSLEG